MNTYTHHGDAYNKASIWEFTSQLSNSYDLFSETVFKFQCLEIIILQYVSNSNESSKNEG